MRKAGFLATVFQRFLTWVSSSVVEQLALNQLAVGSTPTSPTTCQCIMNEKSIAVVFGYLPKIDFISKIANDLNLKRRIAIALDTHRSDMVDMYFDVDLLFSLMNLLLTGIPYDSFVVTLNDNENQKMKSISDISHYYSNIDEDNREPFQSVKVIKRNQTICFIETKLYTQAGGPMPYSDTYTFSFYVEDYKREDIQHTLTHHCEKNRIFIRDIHTGTEEPPLKNKLTRLFSWI